MCHTALLSVRIFVDDRAICQFDDISPINYLTIDSIIFSFLRDKPPMLAELEAVAAAAAVFQNIV